MSRLYRLDEDSIIASSRDGGDGAIRRYLPKQRSEYLNYNQQRRIEGGSLVEQARRVGKKVKETSDKLKESQIISKIAGMVGHLQGDERAKKIEELAKQHGYGQDGGSLKKFIKKVGHALKKGYDYAKKTKIISKGADVLAKGALWTGNPEIAGIAEAVSKGAKQFGLGEHDLYISGSRFMNNFPMRPRGMSYSQGSDPLDFQGSMTATLDNIERNKSVQSIIS